MFFRHLERASVQAVITVNTILESEQTIDDIKHIQSLSCRNNVIMEKYNMAGGVSAPKLAYKETSEAHDCVTRGRAHARFSTPDEYPIHMLTEMLLCFISGHVVLCGFYVLFCIFIGTHYKRVKRHLWYKGYKILR